MILLGWGHTRGQGAGPDNSLDPDKLFAEARPHLEAVLGCRLESGPQLKTVVGVLFPPHADPLLERQIKVRLTGCKKERLEQALSAAQEDLANVAIALYQEGTDIIWVCPQGDRRTSVRRLSGNPPYPEEELSRGSLQLALVRETVHYLLERRYHYRLSRLWAFGPDNHAIQALQTIIEGRVLQVTEKVAERLGLKTEFESLAVSCCLWGRRDLFPRSNVGRDCLYGRYYAGYYGLRFFHYLEEHGFGDAEKKVFTAPPRTMDQIYHPESYLHATQSQKDLTTVLSHLGPSLPAADWTATQQSWSPAMIRQVAELFGEKERAEKIMALWDEGRSLVWTCKKAPGRQVALSVVRFESAEGARSYFGLALDLQRKRDAMVGNSCTAGMQVIESRSADLALRRADQAVRSDKKIQFSSPKTSIPVCTVLARFGNLVLECTWHGLEGDMPWAEKVVDAFFAAI
jgi:hypothetical protein